MRWGVMLHEGSCYMLKKFALHFVFSGLIKGKESWWRKYLRWKVLTNHAFCCEFGHTKTKKQLTFKGFKTLVKGASILNIKWDSKGFKLLCKVFFFLKITVQFSSKITTGECYIHSTEVKYYCKYHLSFAYLILALLNKLSCHAHF